MKKIRTLFVRDPATKHRLVLPEVHEDCGWVVAGEGLATIKYDGTCCAVIGGNLYKRSACPRKLPGWLPVDESPADQWHRQAWARELLGGGDGTGDGTYELVGPKVQRNPYSLVEHALWKHGTELVLDAPRTFDGLKAWLAEWQHEGLVWHHADGRMAKIKRRDFGYPWPATTRAVR